MLIHYFYLTLIFNKEVIGFSTYNWNDLDDTQEKISENALKLAEKIAKYDYQIDNCYVVDICENDSGCHIVEFNKVETSGLYSCNLAKIIDNYYTFIK